MKLTKEQAQAASSALTVASQQERLRHGDTPRAFGKSRVDRVALVVSLLFAFTTALFFGWWYNLDGNVLLNHSLLYIFIFGAPIGIPSYYVLRYVRNLRAHRVN
jgi:hypothetical protein